ncbi:AI-2E family transporter [Lysobacter sp. S4-A87]|uniref:AI-2E family transporter n=1 Tax=Lysobacter sp. S4-A87 TaxID=2925843 RepID=UPI001F535C99|nr:AI-2E family transporter [Lysobacter sp. S4-A87]UNK50150.1 AI-2E family transporter [Lysobacter sp. S4-A87]
MNLDQETLRKIVTTDLTETLIKVGLIAFLAYVCVRVFAPFSNLVILGVILAISIYPLYQGLVRRMGGKRGLSATVLVLALLLLLGVPMVILGSSFASQISEVHQQFEKGSFTVPAPSPKVAEWPLVGERLHTAWSEAANNLPAYLEKNAEIIRGYTRKALAMAANAAGAVLMFLAAIVVAGILMVYAEAGSRTVERILIRLTSPTEGPSLLKLSVATVRSVATGVVGVAFIQALLLGMGFLLAGIPAAGVFAAITMLLGILQLPALIISLPAIGYLWWAEDGSSTGMKVVFTIYFLIAGMADNVLKPLLLGRGVDAPMLVILIGAIGGMVTGGILGLFVGAVLLAVAYKLFMEWVDSRSLDTVVPAAPAEPIDTDTAH